MTPTHAFCTKLDSDDVVNVTMTVKYVSVDGCGQLMVHEFGMAMMMMHGLDPTAFEKRVATLASVDSVTLCEMGEFQAQCAKVGADLDSFLMQKQQPQSDCECGHDKHGLGYSTWCPAFEKHRS